MFTLPAEDLSCLRRARPTPWLLLLLSWCAGSASALGDQCTVVHYLAAGETRPFSFRSGAQFVADLQCVFSFSAPTGQQLSLTISDLDLAPPTGSRGNSTCVDDVLTVYDLAEGELLPIDSYCGNNVSSSQQITLTSNIAVVTFVSHEKMATRSFTITVSATESEQQENETTTPESEEGTEEGETEGREQGEEGEEEGGEGEDEGEGEEGDEGEEDDTDEDEDDNADDEDQGNGTNRQKTAARRPRHVLSRIYGTHRNPEVRN